MDLRLTGITTHLNHHEILRDLDWNVGSGVTGLVGRNGAGKTTLIRTIAGVVDPTKGLVERDRVNVFATKAAKRDHHRSLGWLPQELGMPPRMAVAEFVTYAAWLKRVRTSDRRCEIETALQHVDMSELAGQRLASLSGGQRRRVALAAAIVGSPLLLLLDEPTNGLDPVQRAQFLNVIRVLAEDRIIILASHLLEDLALAADRWSALENGKIIDCGTIDRSSTGTALASLEPLRASIMTGPEA